MSDKMGAVLSFQLNGRPVQEAAAAPTTTLLQYLRGARGLTGSKEGCAEGDCGACTVAVLDPTAPGGPAYRAVNSCLVLLPMVHGKEVVTVEGLAQPAPGGDAGAVVPHLAQDALATALGSQCGYCTPGVVMSMFEACYRQDLDEPWKVDDQMCGNLCRCTGYRPIREATHQVAGVRPDDRFSARLIRSAAPAADLEYQAGDQRYFAPASLGAAYAVLAAHPGAAIVQGGTDFSLAITKRFEAPATVLSLEQIDELRGFADRGDHWWLGAGLRLSDLEAVARGILPPVERMLRFFGARQIKHRGTVGGNVANASPIGDLPPVLLALGASIVLGSARGERALPLGDFFLAYRKTALQAGELVLGVRVPKLAARGVRASAYKVSKRQELDISTTAAAFFVRTDDAGVVTEARLAYGGMAAVPARARGAEAALVGQRWDAAGVERACAALEGDFRPLDDHRGSAWYRRTLAANLLRGFFLETESTAYPRHAYRPTGTVVPLPRSMASASPSSTRAEVSR